jgi:hypothetical protein
VRKSRLRLTLPIWVAPESSDHVHEAIFWLKNGLRAFRSGQAPRKRVAGQSILLAKALG